MTAAGGDEPSWAVDVTAYAEPLARVVQAVDAALAPPVPTSAAGIPRDHAARLRSGLSGSAPTPVLGDLGECGHVPDVALPAALGPLPPVVGVQVLAAYGLLTGRSDPWRTAPHDRLRTMLLRGRPVDLLEVEALLAGAGVPDAPTFLARALLQTEWDGTALAADWPTRLVAPWVARHAEVVLAVHEREARAHGYSRRRFVALLGLLDPLPDRVADWLFARALGARAADRAESRALLARHPERAARAAVALRDRAAGVRASAASWLAEAPLPSQAEVVAALEDAARTETDDLALGALLDALEAHGRRAVEFVDRDALDAAAAKAATKALPASLSWLDPATLPRVHWADSGEEVAVATVRSWVQQAVKAKSPEPGALVRTVLSAVEPEDRTALADALLHLWLAAGAPSASRGLLAVVALGAGERAALLAADVVRTRAKQAGTQAQALVALLARIDEPAAVQAIVEAADTSGSASVRKAAAAEVAALAERRGWTVEQVGDRGAPTAGFDASGRMRLDYGPRGFTAVLQPDLKVVVEPDDAGKTRTSLPPARASDDPELVAAAKAALAAAKKTVTATYRTQSARLREALATQRAWTVEAWRADVAGHPVLGRIATGLVWAVGDLTFRPLDDGTLTDADDEPVDLDPYAAAGEPVRLAHDVLLPREVADAWREHLADYEVVVPFTQLGEPLPPPDPDSTGLTDAVGVQTSQGALHRLAEKAGFRRIVGDGGTVVAYARDLPGVVAGDSGGEGEVGALLEVRGGSWVGDWSATVELGPLLFTSPGGPVTLGSLPPVLLAEVRRDLRSLAG